MKVNRFADLPFKEVLKKGSDGVGGGTIDLSFLEGCQVIKAGYLDQKQLKDLDRVEGGFAIDYSRGNKAYRVVFGSSDFGLWIEWKGEIG